MIKLGRVLASVSHSFVLHSCHITPNKACQLLLTGWCDGSSSNMFESPKVGYAVSEEKLEKLEKLFFTKGK